MYNICLLKKTKNNSQIFCKNGIVFPYFGLNLGIDSRNSIEKWELDSKVPYSKSAKLTFFMNFCGFG
jgi:hypothetical protein